MELQDTIQVLLILVSLAIALYTFMRYREVSLKLERIIHREMSSRGDTSGIQNRSRKLLKVGDKKRLKRYLIFKVYSIEEIGFSALENSFLNHIKRSLGEIGMVYTSVKLIKYDPNTGLGIVRIVGEDPHLVALVISRLRRIDNAKAIIAPIRITGSLKKAYKYLSRLSKS